MAVMRQFLADHDFLARHAQHDMHVRRVAAGLLALVRHFDHHPAADDVVVQLFQFAEMLVHRVLECVGRVDVVEGKLERNVH